MIDLLEDIKENFGGQVPITSPTNSRTSTLPPQGAASSLRQDSNSSRVTEQTQNRDSLDLDDLNDLGDIISSNDREDDGRSSWNFFDDDD